MALAGTALKTARAAPSTSPRSQRKVQRGADIVRQHQVLALRLCGCMDEAGQVRWSGDHVPVARLSKVGRRTSLFVLHITIAHSIISGGGGAVSAALALRCDRPPPTQRPSTIFVFPSVRDGWPACGLRLLGPGWFGNLREAPRSVTRWGVAADSIRDAESKTGFTSRPRRNPAGCDDDPIPLAHDQSVPAHTTCGRRVLKDNGAPGRSNCGPALP
ncbi:hypothetical protein ACCO45_007954 [Purpureocillium lilacinum]|uniref:Uncharacterized protein n=1 Tax=Purpureocillium lilacinum TaxID=33203 RepID=A0ACC4DLW1_PURLI